MLPGEGTHSMEVTTYAPPFRPPYFRSLENLYSFDPSFWAKMRKMSYFDPYFLSKFGKMYSFDPPFLPLCSISCHQAVLSIPIQNPTENPPPPPPPPPRGMLSARWVPHSDYNSSTRAQQGIWGQWLGAVTHGDAGWINSAGVLPHFTEDDPLQGLLRGIVLSASGLRNVCFHRVRLLPLGWWNRGWKIVVGLLWE